MSPQAIDLHAHWLPPVMAQALRQRHDQVPRIDPLADGSEHMVMPSGTLNFNTDFTSASQRLAHMSQLGVGKQMLSLPGLFGIDCLPFDQSAPLVRIFNDACAGLCQAHPERFCGLAALPWVNLHAAVAELRRARLELGLLGAILPVDAFRSETSAAQLLPLFEAAEDLGAHFLVHPGHMPDSAALPLVPPDHHWARQALAVQHDVGQAMVTLLLSDFLRPWRNIAVQVAHLGGSFAAVVEPKLVQLDQNRVDVIFEINEGPQTGISAINVLGNKAFSDNDVRDVMVTERSQWWKFFSNNDNYDPNRLEYDQEQLRKFYTNRGYYDFRVVSAVAELAPNRKGFVITYTLEEGVRYKFGAISVETGTMELPIGRCLKGDGAEWEAESCW